MIMGRPFAFRVRVRVAPACLPFAGLAVFLASAVFAAERPAGSAPPAVGARGHVGCGENPRNVRRLLITRPGIYENYLVDARWDDGNRVKIMADNVTLRNCEIRNASGNGVGVFGENVVIENCRIHHLLRGTYREQDDAHGITGHPRKLTIRNCSIYYVSGDAIQFDPSRMPWGDVLIEDCTLWTGPLPEDAAGFKRGERPGENAFDSKTPPVGDRSKVTFRNCYMYGWNQPSQITVTAALNLKENVHARVENCLFRDNEVCFRLRGPGKRRGALVEIKDCAVYDSQVGVRMEDKIENTKIEGLGFGSGVVRKYHMVGRGPFPGYENSGDCRTPPFSQLLQTGFGMRDSGSLTTDH